MAEAKQSGRSTTQEGHSGAVDAMLNVRRELAQQRACILQTHLTSRTSHLTSHTSPLTSRLSHFAPHTAHRTSCIPPIPYHRCTYIYIYIYIYPLSPITGAYPLSHALHTPYLLSQVRQELLNSERISHARYRDAVNAAAADVSTYLLTHLRAYLFMCLHASATPSVRLQPICTESLPPAAT